MVQTPGAMPHATLNMAFGQKNTADMSDAKTFDLGYHSRASLAVRERLAFFFCVLAPRTSAELRTVDAIAVLLHASTIGVTR
jgi:hypothetical protein